MEYVRKKLEKINSIELFKHGKFYLIGNILSKGLLFLTMPIYIRILPSPSEYGLLNIYSSVVNMLVIILGLNVHAALLRYYHEKDGQFSWFCSSIVKSLLIFDVLILFIINRYKNVFSIYLNIDSNILIVIVIVTILQIYLNMYLTYLKASKQSNSFLKLSVLSNLFIILLSIVIMLFLKEKKYLGEIYSKVLINFIVILFLAIKFVKIYKNKKLNFNHIKYVLLYSAPLIPHSLSNYLLAHADKILINKYVGSYETGIYSLAYNIGMIMNVIVISLNNAWVPIFFEKLREEKYSEIELVAKKYTSFIFIAASFLIVFSKELIGFIAKRDYYEGVYMIPIVIIGYVFVFLYTIYTNYAFYYKKTILISMNTIIAGIINIALNCIFIPKAGYIAAAYTTLFSYVILFILHYFNSKYLIKARVVSIKIFMKPIIGIFFTMLVFYFTNIYIINYLVGVLIKLVIITVIVSIILKMNRKG
ncbi:MAG: oligosaccharide flippase family protein [Anaeromicrobium sp.]|jgi:O-antigen/teichoic acid export membrane protein|uniref:lipopolysaccharide biosynthesis protein n=1 Tax=Anaeromicrobium sp. TaxID=1929132 RepID=UPI0025D53732|nr:oligosaccharide flippase family protein [Anaeromicrobium sp.]MCT4593968.1 oligosaccharide flippase family protein [Anaeromicrobium sp.]